MKRTSRAWKQTIAMVLTVVMIMSMLPALSISAFAAGGGSRDSNGNWIADGLAGGDKIRKSSKGGYTVLYRTGTGGTGNRWNI